MIPDITPQLGIWVDLYALTGIAVGTRLVIQSKNVGRAVVWEGAAPPGDSTEAQAHGVELTNRGDSCSTSAAPPGCWLIAWSTTYGATKGRFCVQELTL